MPFLPQSPYDTLATVTSQVRTVLADYIQGLVPNPQGKVNTNGTSITWVSGNQFTIYFNGAPILINNINYVIGAVTSPTTATLLTTAGVQTAVAYTATIQTGEIFADNQAYVLPTINLAWRKLQKKLDYASHPRMRNEVTIFRLPVAGSTDPATYSYINWTGFNDGVNQSATPFLPPDFLAPMRIFERVSVAINATNTANFSEMSPVADGLPSTAKGTYNRVWDWREDAIYFVGATQITDLRILYQAFLPDIAMAGGSFSSTIVPLMRSTDSLAYYAAAIFVSARGGAMLAADWEMKGDEATDALTNRQAKVLQRGSYRRRAVYNSSTRRY